VNHLSWIGNSKEGSEFPAELKITGVLLSPSRKTDARYQRPLTGIVDTGADSVVIPEYVVEFWSQRGVIQEGTWPAEDFRGDSRECPFYFVDIDIPFTLSVKMEVAVVGKSDHVLIGRSVLAKAEMLVLIDGKHRRWSLGDATDGRLKACEDSQLLKPMSASRGIFRWEG
jgi:hypothetical protein